MAPRRKKARLGAAGAAEISSGSGVTAVATSMGEVPKLQQDCMSILESMYELRHDNESKVHTQARGLLTPTDGLFPFPVTFGGTFQSIAERAFKQPEILMELAAKLAHDAGLLDAPDKDDFISEFCRINVPGP